ncbi:DMT family transporter [Waterburya agarophytonicola K14]|uniref:DMT family transporter n=1 Tax=Waterburya agarophytonicola KI4 TaxID=2874699 RepID=A0A964BU09_9CYAN|nr:DMT family transporter [Waterburya agarophytonicola]MCC0178216.1 DMT family transporter [Waterburya agarophytonicola KI4]
MQLSSNSTSSFPRALLLIAPFFLWGTAMVAMKSVIPNTTPFFIAGVRLVPAGFLVLLVAAILKLPQPKTITAWLWILAFALVDGAMFQGFLAQGIVKTGAGLGSVMIDSQPLAVALLSSLLFGEIIGFWGWLGLGIGVLGISLIGLPDRWIYSVFAGDLEAVNINWLGLFDNGEWLMLLASLSMAVGTVMIPYISRHSDPVVATGWHMILGGLPLFGLSWLGETEQWNNLSIENWLALGYATVFGSAIAYGIFFYLASKGNLTSLSALTFLTPIFALLFGTIILAEVLSPLQSVGVLLTVVSIYLINQRDAIAAKFKAVKGESI